MHPQPPGHLIAGHTPMNAPPTTLSTCRPMQSPQKEAPQACSSRARKGSAVALPRRVGAPASPALGARPSRRSRRSRAMCGHPKVHTLGSSSRQASQSPLFADGARVRARQSSRSSSDAKRTSSTSGSVFPDIALRKHLRRRATAGGWAAGPAIRSFRQPSPRLLGHLAVASADAAELFGGDPSEDLSPHVFQLSTNGERQMIRAVDALLSQIQSLVLNPADSDVWEWRGPPEKISRIQALTSDEGNSQASPQSAPRR